MPADEVAMAERIARPPRPHFPSAEEVIAHQAMLRVITEPIWLAEG
jgi:DNA polymerase-3 subunit epsilon